MHDNVTTLSTGLPGLDKALQGLLPGDNVVWEVDSIADYVPLVEPFVIEAERQGRKLIYFRFARHASLLADGGGAVVHHLQAEGGFEKFLTEILDVIETAGRGAFYVFDCLSDLAADWFSDHMLGNFFMIACPFLYELETVAYFALLKNQHSFHATDAINKTAQVVLEVHRKKNRLYIHPLKVYQRYSPTMYMLQSWEGDEFRPVTSSATITDILAGAPQPVAGFHHLPAWGLDPDVSSGERNARRSGQRRQDGARGRGLFPPFDENGCDPGRTLCGAGRKYFDLADLIEIMKRMIGTGLIGGKSLGMLLARAILKKADPCWEERLEGHDSFFIGSDVFTRTGPERLLVVAAAAQGFQRLFGAIRDGPPEIAGRRVSSIHPGSVHGDARVFWPVPHHRPLEQPAGGQLRQRLFGQIRERFLREPRHAPGAFGGVHVGGADRLCQHHEPGGIALPATSRLARPGRTDGAAGAKGFGRNVRPIVLPQVAGVGFSFNPFVWHEEIDPRAGMLRLVFGLGTRAVDRTDDDYTRLVALNAPLKRPERNTDEVRQYSQRRADVLDLQANQLVTRDFQAVAQSLPQNLLR